MEVLEFLSSTAGFYAFFIFSIGYLFIRSIIQVQENQRCVVLRFGEIIDVLGPGLNFIMPVVENPVFVNLTKHFPGWQSMDVKELHEKVIDIVRNDPNGNYK